MTFVKVTSKSEIKENSLKEFEVNGKSIAIANANGSYFAIDNVCTHDGGPLGEGEIVDGCCVECPRHGAKFDLKTGEVKALPAPVGIHTYSIKIDGDDILVDI